LLAAQVVSIPGGSAVPFFGYWNMQSAAGGARTRPRQQAIARHYSAAGSTVLMLWLDGMMVMIMVRAAGSSKALLRQQAALEHAASSR
jgi:hypothetical protein